MKLIADNRKARFDYFLEDKFEAGIELFGWEVKSARAGEVNLQDSFVYFGGGENNGAGAVECYLKNAHFSKYEYGDIKEQQPKRDRKLLLSRVQINRLHAAVKAKGYTCVAVKIYFNQKGLIKVEIALAKGKHNFDKKKVLKEKDIAREAERAVRGR